MQVLKEEIRNKILQVSEKMFYELGFQTTSMRKIATEVNVSVSNLYKYFQNKEALYNEITQEFYYQFLSKMKEFFAHEHDQTNMIKLDRIKEVSSVISDVIMKDRIKFVIIMDKSEGTRYQDFKEKLIKGVKNHILDDIDRNKMTSDFVVEVLSRNFWEAILNITRDFRDKERFHNDIDLFIRYHLAGIAPFFK